MSGAPIEVRRCPACNEAALVVVNAWQHSVNGVVTEEVTRDYRCQQCGAWQVRRPRSTLIAWWIVGVVLLPTCLGLPFLILAYRLQTFDARVPLVPGAAPPPRLRFPGGPPERTCSCQGVAVARTITRHTHKGLPTGTDYGYECGACRKTFETENVLGTITSTLGAALAGFIGLAFFASAESPAWKWGGGLVTTGLALYLVVQTATRVVNRFKYPPVESQA